MAAAFESWAIVELMGHRKLAGFVSEVSMFGVVLLKIDVPCDPPVTQYYGGASIFSLTPTTEELARAAAQASRPTPISRYELPRSSRRTDDESDYEDEDLERPSEPDDFGDEDSDAPL